MNIARHIRAQIESIPVGQPFTSAEFLGVGMRASIDQALSRLVKVGKITRLARGVFVRPELNRFVGEVLPKPEQVAKAIAGATGETIEVNGAEAARRFELSTQVPTRPVFYTTGKNRKFRLGNLEVELRRVAPRKLALAGTLAGQALVALWYLGKEQVTEETFETLKRNLPAPEYLTLTSAKAKMPAWMSDKLIRYEKVTAHA